MKFKIACLVVSCIAFVASIGVAADDRGKPWKRHTIDDSSRGADGVRLVDVNGDGLLDIATGWEEGGKIRVYRNPGPKKSEQLWPAVTVGNVRSPEDAVFVDLDRDGAFDVVSSCEGRNRTMFVHWAPREKGQYLSEKHWTTDAIPASAGKRSWMFCLPMQVDGRSGVDLVAAAKGNGAEIGWFESPRNPRKLSDWKWHPIYKAGWIMSLFARDMDGDGDLDLLTTDRKGGSRGCRWLENPSPGEAQKQLWKSHLLGGADREVMFMTPTDLDRDGRLDVLAAVRGGDLLFLRQATPTSWDTHTIRMPPETGTGKGVAVADIDLNGTLDVVFSCENARGKSGIMWLSRRKSQPSTSANWLAHEISGRKQGVKFDRIELVDFDGDGDFDVLTCEERDNLGVVWYENPHK
ncbi:MAG: VCBS repeat-containing protein [Planctomycetaceae bacterium]|jgi:hypothetical protein|nr:VCBS repeat-containing protein [Planctomycetaceae bacterium]MBT6483162.1 VCBS repeat-containing protein [Planctomycetaceae bacterium]MBT6497764.1 VCBS repeat-containing protein [Planctomycetaceae bacterium]